MYINKKRWNVKHNTDQETAAKVTMKPLQNLGTKCRNLKGVKNLPVLKRTKKTVA